MVDTILLDLRDERGRFFTKVRLPLTTFNILEAIAKLEGITFEELLHRAIEEHTNRVLDRDGTL